MDRVSKFTSRVVPLVADNIDTDQIVPARFLKVTDKKGLSEMLFADWKRLGDGRLNPDFPLNWETSRGAEVLLGGDNFGCGSSREHAPWALRDWGFRAIIARSFGDIFRNNALKNGLLPVQVDRATHERLRRSVEKDRAAQVTVDLESCALSLPDGSSCTFLVDPFARQCLLSGVDELGYLLSLEPRIGEYEAKHC
jgi:3-isopropylmalate/(R)-2-methylmalate dehydratase small subunit